MRVINPSARDWALIILIFLCLTLVFSIGVHIEDIGRGEFTWWQGLFLEATGAGSSLALLPFLFRLGERFAYQKEHWFRITLTHLGLSLVYGFCHSSLMMISRAWLSPVMGFDYRIDPFEVYLYEYHKQLMSYALTLGVVHAWLYFHREQEKERQRAALAVRNARLEAQLAQSRLHALEAQLHPHFLFNTLNAVSSIMYEDVDRADTMIADLSRLLRMALEDAEQPKATLERERRFLILYLDIMKGRYEKNLEVSLDPVDHAARLLVPNLITQPLVENSFKHMDIAPGRPARIHIAARVEEDNLILTVEDNGPGLDADPETCMARGTGIRNTRARLQTLYGDRASLDLINRREGGLTARLILPVETVDHGEVNP